VFSTFRHTLHYLLQRTAGATCAWDSSTATVRMISAPNCAADFRCRGPRTTRSTSSFVGCEGLDFQFCDLRYDLPWNLMRIEQRIGHVDR
jgi:ATP-dependent helicase HepA